MLLASKSFFQHVASSPAARRTAAFASVTLIHIDSITVKYGKQEPERKIEVGGCAKVSAVSKIT
jgi:hypothetical protein